MAAVAELGHLLCQDLPTEAMQSRHRAALAQAASGLLDEAEAMLGALVAEAPAQSSWWRDLGVVRLARDQPGAAAQAMETCISLNPSDTEARLGLARALAMADQMEAARDAAISALEIEPESFETHRWLARLYRTVGQYPGARYHQSECVRLRPDQIDERTQLALDYWKEDDIEASLRACAALAASGEATLPLHSFYLYLLLFDPAQTPQSLRAAYSEWARRFCTKTPPDAGLDEVDWNPERRLRIGYLSGEFMHGAAFVSLSPLFLNHDRSQVELFAYHVRDAFDHVTAWYRDLFGEGWRDCRHLDDDALFRQIREDRIDVLVDLAGHCAMHKLCVVARRAAPIQAGHPVYPFARNIPNMDYLLSDRWTAPPESRAYMLERPLHIPGGVMAYAPPPESPETGPLPALANGFVTFGLFQRRTKLNSFTLDLVAAVLEQCPSARLLIHHGDPELDSPEAPSRESLIRSFVERGVASHRLRFVGARSRARAMATMAEADIALDSTPYSGHTTTSECLWMGVPVVTLAGSIYQSRVSAGLLHEVGLGCLAAEDFARYVAIAVALASDLEALAQLRGGMRARLASSPFLDGRRLAREVEQAFREIWRQECARHAGSET